MGTRNEMHKLIKEKGGIIKDSVVKTLNYLVVGEDAGSKIEKALSYGITIISEKEFFDLIK